MNKSYALILLLTLTISCQREIKSLSPNNAFELQTSKGENHSLIISIYDKNDILLHTWNTRASRIHKWSVEWVNNNELLMKSSDIGPLSLVRQPDGTWKIDNPLKTLSPDGKLVAYTWWNSKNLLTLTLMEARGSEEKTLGNLQEFKTHIAVSNLENCAKWLNNNRLLIVADEGEHYWVRNSDGLWVKDNL